MTVERTKGPDNVRVPAARSRNSDQTLQVVQLNCSGMEGVTPQALGFTYWFDAKPAGAPYSVTIRFSGTRQGIEGKATSSDRFSVLRTVDRVIPGSGRVALTTRVLDIEQGEWQITAEPVLPGSKAKAPQAFVARRTTLPSASTSGTTSFAPVVRVRAPGVRLGAWPALVLTGAVVALVLQAVLAQHRGLPTLRLLAVSLIASVVGIVGAKLYYLATHRDEDRGLLVTGMSIQGFVLGAIAAVILGGLLVGIPIGQYLDVLAPGLLFGMAIGRLGCFFGGCCAGKATGSRWALWSSDRTIGVRRIPVQLVESAVAGALAVLATGAVWWGRPAVDGAVFVAAIAGYTFARQLLFPLRGIPRTTAHGRVATMVVMGLILVLDLAVAVLA